MSGRDQENAAVDQKMKEKFSKEDQEINRTKELSKKADQAVAEAEAKAKSVAKKEEGEKEKQAKAEALNKQKEIGHSQGQKLKKELDIASKVKSLSSPAQQGAPATGGLMQMQTSE